MFTVGQMSPSEKQRTSVRLMSQREVYTTQLLCPMLISFLKLKLFQSFLVVTVILVRHVKRMAVVLDSGVLITKLLF